MKDKLMSLAERARGAFGAPLGVPAGMAGIDTIGFMVNT